MCYNSACYVKLVKFKLMIWVVWFGLRKLWRIAATYNAVI